VAPPQPSWDGLTNLTVKVELLLYTPLVPATPAGRGIGPDADAIDGGSVVSTLPVTSALSIALVRNRTAGATAVGDWRSLVFGTALMYTYVGPGATCGCDVSVASVCDACGKTRRVCVCECVIRIMSGRVESCRVASCLIVPHRTSLYLLLCLIVPHHVVISLPLSATAIAACRHDDAWCAL
jgi:hypothetical protein